jgi:hypothetical protein
MILVAQGGTRDFNPDLPQSLIDRALERDAPAASAEYLAQFSPFSPEAVTEEYAKLIGPIKYPNLGIV